MAAQGGQRGRHVSVSASGKGKIQYYTLYERLWHWVQALSILGLILSGALLVFPWQGAGGVFSRAVASHHLCALALVVNGVLGLFYNLASGLIRRYVPTTEDIFPLGLRHARYYLFGIFKGEDHPFDRTPEKRLLPLQKVTYFVVLNLLLPFMVITGGLRYSVEYEPSWIEQVGGLSVIAPLHRFGAWLFLAFVIVHIYMTTTGKTPLSNLRTMITCYGEHEAVLEKNP